MINQSTQLRPSSAPTFWIAGGFALLLGLFLGLQGLSSQLPESVSRTVADFFPMAAILLSGGALLAGLGFVQMERRRVAEVFEEQKRLHETLLKGLQSLQQGQFELSIPQDVAQERTVRALFDLRNNLQIFRKDDDLRRKHIEGISSFSDVLRRHSEIAPLAQELIRELAQYLNAGQGALFVIEDSKNDRLRLSSYYVSGEVENLEKELYSGEGLIGQALRERKTLVLSDVPEPYVQIRSGLGEAAPRNLLLVPMTVEGRLMGLIELAGFQPFSPRDVAFVEELAAKTGVTIFNLQTSRRTTEMLTEAQNLTQELQIRETRLLQNTEEIRRTQTALIDSQKRVDTMMQNVPDVIFQMTQFEGQKRQFSFVSERAQELLGLNPEKVKSGAVSLAIHPDDLSAFEQKLQLSTENLKPFYWEGRIQHTNGTYRWFRASATTQQKENQYIWDGTLSDITNTKEYEVGMRLRERAITSSSSGIVIADMLQKDQPLTYVNPAFEQITGYAQAEALGRNCRFLQKDDHDQPGLQVIREALAEGRECQVLLRNYRKDGTLFWNELNLSPVRDEQGQITHFVGVQNDVSQRIESESRIRQMNETLEERVEARTSELQAAMEELKSAQYRIVQSEKLASLGQLVAGVAHEINTPLAAIKAGAENMTEFLPRAIEDLPELLASLSPELREKFRQMIAVSMNQSDQLSTRDERRVRKELEEQLKAADIEDWRDLAKKLMLNGIREDISPYLPILELPNSKDLIQTAYHVGQMKTNLDVIHQAAAKTRKTVYALKRYSHFQQDETPEKVDLVDSMEVILTLYHNQLKHGISVEKSYAEHLPPIQGYGDELGQVWTNIIHNAAQAMDNNGKIRIELGRVSPEGDAFVRITDSGPGIPAEIQQKIFEPFFTTKPQGEGTGLGLDICKKIVEKHRGSLSVESEPGRTSFLITLPYLTEEDLVEQVKI